MKFEKVIFGVSFTRNWCDSLDRLSKLMGFPLKLMRPIDQPIVLRSAHYFPVNMSAAAAPEKQTISGTIDAKTIGFFYVNPNQLSPFSNIRKVREAQIGKVITSLAANGWDSSYSILAMEMVPQEGSPEARTYPTSLEQLSDLSEEEVRPAF